MESNSHPLAMGTLDGPKRQDTNSIAFEMAERNRQQIQANKLVEAKVRKMVRAKAGQSTIDAVYGALVIMKFILILGLSLLVLAIAVQSQAPSALPSGYKDNPYEYRYGNISDISYSKQSSVTTTLVTFRPVGAYLLFKEPIEICGDQSEKLEPLMGKALVVTITKRMVRKTCHQLVRVDIIEKAHLMDNDPIWWNHMEEGK